MDELLFGVSQRLDSTAAVAGVVIGAVTIMLTHNKSVFVRFFCNSLAVLLIAASAFVGYADFAMADMREVPNLINQTRGNALNSVSGTDLTPIWSESEADGEGLYVIEQEPEAFTIVPKGTTVTLVCSEHPVSEIVSVDAPEETVDERPFGEDLNPEVAERVTLTECVINGDTLSGSFAFEYSAPMDLVCRGRFLKQAGESHWEDISDQVYFERSGDTFVFRLKEPLQDGRYECDLQFYAEEYDLRLEIYITSKSGVLQGESYLAMYGFDSHYHSSASGELEPDGSFR